MEGEVPFLDFMGIVFGHIYYHLKTVGILKAPAPLVRWYETSPLVEGIRARYKEISADFN